MLSTEELHLFDIFGLVATEIANSLEFFVVLYDNVQLFYGNAIFLAFNLYHELLPFLENNGLDGPLSRKYFGAITSTSIESLQDDANQPVCQGVVGGATSLSKFLQQKQQMTRNAICTCTPPLLDI